MEEAIQGCLTNLDATLSSLKTSYSTQGLRDIVTPYAGDSNKCREWLTNVEKFAELNGEETNNGKIRLAYMSARGAVSDFIKRFTAETPRDEITWPNLTKNLIAHFSVVSDSEHAHDVLRKIKQRPGETVSFFSERIYELAKDAYADHDLENKPGAKEMAERQLVNYFVDGLSDRSVKLKVLRKGCRTLGDALAVARDEATFIRRFELRNPRQYRDRARAVEQDIDGGEEPMDIDVAQLRTRRECRKCGRMGHYARDCTRGTSRNLVRCLRCDQFGHMARDCKNRSDTHEIHTETQNGAQRRSIICWHCNKPGHIKRECPEFQAPRHYRNRGRPFQGPRDTYNQSENYRGVSQ